ncbi:MAG: glycerate kinase [Chloroflexi bacterium]|nr:glycerate kinase [Chloroflexota bacterium]MYF23037.1 glycerate kinase [Chloroflexota bacterium]
MRVLIAPQEFKGSLTAVEAVDAIQVSVARVMPDAEIDRAPLADGGPGTVEAIVHAARGRTSIARVDGPLGAPVDACWGRIDDGRCAVIEMAAASGLTLLSAGELDVDRASTYGTGQLIVHALDSGVERILIGVGGSATNDGGACMAEALGAVLLDEHDRRLPSGGAALARLARIDVRQLDPRLDRTDIRVLCDVRNPLLGPKGASAVYGPQKGAKPAQVAQLDRALANYAAIVERDLGVRVADIPGGGAAGGLAAGLVAFCGATLQSGFDAVADAVGLADRVAQADLVITGEGRLDTQSAYGKTVAGVAALSRSLNVPCLAVAGLIEGDAAVSGIADREASTPEGVSVEDAMTRADELVRDAVVRLLQRYSR